MDRTDLSKKLHSIADTCGAKVYFQPPSSQRMEYPCIRYSLENIRTDKANDANYKTNKEYLVTVIDVDPDSEIPDRVLDLEYVSFDRFYVSNNLNHWVFSIFI